VPLNDDSREKLFRDVASDIDPERLRELHLISPQGTVVPGTITMMFTDVVDSTRINAKLGDDAYLQALDKHHGLMRQCLKKHFGHELKTIGDSFFAGFQSVNEAVACAAAIQQELDRSPIPVGAEFIAVRIGVHTGEPTVLLDKVSGRIDLLGTAVNKAARVEGLAVGGQVLASEETHTLAKQHSAHDWGMWELKGLGRNRIFEILRPGKEPQSPRGRRVQLPLRFLTSFIGRERELNDLMDDVKQHRLVTLKGTGGIGKTRLADQIARRLSDLFSDGVFFVPLTDISNSRQAVVSELITCLAIKTAGFPSEEAALIHEMKGRTALLVLDNFEAVQSISPILHKLLLECPELHLVVTSQIALAGCGKTTGFPLGSI
jgi:class 3 adenylate cyclase